MNTLTSHVAPTTAYAATQHRLPSLPYPRNALEPCIDSRTMTLHHDVHHAGYVAGLNATLSMLPQFHDAPALWLLCNLSQVPREQRASVHHNAGGHVNHSLFWQSMTPDPVGEIPGRLRAALCASFGSVAAFQSEFETAGSEHFGSGWVWLLAPLARGGKLEIVTTVGHDHPLMKNRTPLLLNDVWEHAYYLQYENRRAAYLKAWWAVVNWDVANRRFENHHH